MKILSAVLELFRADRQTDGDILIGAAQGCERSQNIHADSTKYFGGPRIVDPWFTASHITPHTEIS
jgi:hypothetical protein